MNFFRVLSYTQIAVLERLKRLGQELEQLLDILLIHERDEVLKDAAQVLVEDHPQREARLVDVLVQGYTHAHQYYFDHLLELVAGHLHFVKKAFRSCNFITHNRQPSCRMP